MARKKTRKSDEKLSFSNEIILLLLLASGILLLISNFGVGGFVGGSISSFFFGIFGFIAYFFPLMPFMAAAFLMSNRKNKTAKKRLLASLLLVFFLCLFVELVIATEMRSPAAAFFYGFDEKNGGGLIGGALSFLFRSAFGLIGAYVISVVALIICLILITERSFLGGLRTGGRKFCDVARNEKARLESHHTKRRLEKKVSGVSLDTRIHEPEPILISEPEHLIKEITEPELPISEGEEVPDMNLHTDFTSYRFPPLSLLKKRNGKAGDSPRDVRETAQKLQDTLKSFGVKVNVTDASLGPSVTRYEIQLDPGVKVNSILNRSDDIKLNLAAPDIRIEAPIPGKAALGIEVPNRERMMVSFRDMVDSTEFQNYKSNICFTVGKDIGGQVVVADIAKMPHLLIAGTTGSGKSICLHAIIMSILYKANPDDVKLILIDPKMLEFSRYNGSPHLCIPVVVDPKKAAGALHWAVSEMQDRYQKFTEHQARDVQGYNEKIAMMQDTPDPPKKLPKIVIVVDELADLMMVAGKEVEAAIVRLAQLARAAGIHLILATQRPSVNVVTGLIKANMPSRIALSLSSFTDSRTILDMGGAEKLIGKGDMLYKPQEFKKPLRIQGPFISEEEIEAVVGFLKKQTTVVYDTEIEEKINIPISEGISNKDEEHDPYFVEAGKIIIEKDKASATMLQRWLKIGFNRAARIMDELAEAGVVGPEEGTKPRKILMDIEQFEMFLELGE